MQKIEPGDVITFTEYSISELTQRKRIRQRMENMIVVDVISGGQILPKDKIEEYFGPELSETDCRHLSVSEATRLILGEDDGTKHCVEISRDFLQTGLQTVEIGARPIPSVQEAPSYLQFMNAFGGASES